MCGDSEGSSQLTSLLATRQPSYLLAGLQGKKLRGKSHSKGRIEIGNANEI